MDLPETSLCAHFLNVSSVLVLWQDLNTQFSVLDRMIQRCSCSLGISEKVFVSQESVSGFRKKGADLWGSPGTSGFGELPGKFGKLPGNLWIAGSSTVRTSGEVAEKLPGKFPELPGKSGDFPGAWGSSTRQMCRQELFSSRMIAVSILRHQWQYHPLFVKAFLWYRANAPTLDSSCPLQALYCKRAVDRRGTDAILMFSRFVISKRGFSFCELFFPLRVGAGIPEK